MPVKIHLGNSFLPDGNKPLPEPGMTYELGPYGETSVKI